jgi:hypothetical protein
MQPQPFRTVDEVLDELEAQERRQSEALRAFHERERRELRNKRLYDGLVAWIAFLICGSVALWIVRGIAWGHWGVK